MKNTNRKMQAESLIDDFMLRADKVLARSEEAERYNVMGEDETRRLIKEEIKSVFGIEKEGQPISILSDDYKAKLDDVISLPQRVKARKPLLKIESKGAFVAAILGIISILTLFISIIVFEDSSLFLAFESYSMAVERGDEHPGDWFDEFYQLDQSGQHKEVRKLLKQQRSFTESWCYCSVILKDKIVVERILDIKEEADHVACFFTSAGKVGLALIFQDSHIMTTYDARVLMSSNPDRYIGSPDVEWIEY